MPGLIPGRIVETTSGRVQGLVGEGIDCFKGIPFGDDVGGGGRFGPSRPPVPWTGVLEAFEHGPTCPQVRGHGYRTRMTTELAAAAGRLPRQGEDLLRLNVWTPRCDPADRRPVLVWLHGGGHDRGTASLPLTDGSALARRGDVVVVSANHRLGVLGYLHLAEHDPERFPASGNVGLLDLVAVLRWVAGNIAAFGGDPANVTVVGLSGGGAKLTTLLAMPAAAGLFHQAVVRSGVDLWAHSSAEAAGLADELLAELGIDGRSVGALLEVPARRLLDAAAIVGARDPGASFGPTIDGLSLHGHPVDEVTRDVGAPVPLMIGSTRDEAGLLVPDDGPAPSPLVGLGRVMGPGAGKIFDTYRRARPGASDEDVFVAVVSDRVRVPGLLFAEAYQRGGRGPAFVYEVAIGHPADVRRHGAVHGIDLPLLFDTWRLLPSMARSPGMAEAAELVAGTVLAFARSGRPVTHGVADWPEYDVANRPTLVLDGASRLVFAPREAERGCWRPADLRHGSGLVSRATAWLSGSSRKIVV